MLEKMPRFSAGFYNPREVELGNIRCHYGWLQSPLWKMTLMLLFGITHGQQQEQLTAQIEFTLVCLSFSPFNLFLFKR